MRRLTSFTLFLIVLVVGQPVSAQDPGEHIDVDGVEKVFSTAAGDIEALKAIDLDIAPGEFVCLLGPSGCGKSTLLNAIAGFSPPSAGSIQVSGTPLTRPGPDRGMVFQEYALFLWMSVARNIAFGLEIKGLRRNEIEARVGSLLDMLGLTDFRDRFPKDSPAACPRDPSDPAFNVIRKELGLLVMQEQQRFSDDERKGAARDSRQSAKQHRETDDA